MMSANTFALFLNVTSLPSLILDETAPRWLVDENFLSIAIDSHVVAERWKNFNFSDPGVRHMAAALAPAYLRLGGTAADLLTFDPVQERSWYPTNHIADSEFSSTKCFSAANLKGEPVCEDLGNFTKNRTKFTMSGWDWDAINDFCADVGWDFIFDANVLFGRLDGNGNRLKKWDTSNIRRLLKYSSSRKYGGITWELGNEPNSLRHQLNVTLPASYLGRDFARFRKLLNKFPVYVNAKLIGPDVNHVDKCRPRKRKHNRSRRRNTCKPLRYMEKVIRSSNFSLNALTWHQYYLDGHTAQLEDFLSLTPLRKFENALKAILEWKEKLERKDTPLWMGETSSAFGGGAKGLSDRYVAGFLWLDKLGSAAAHQHSVVIRQTFYHGSYAMIGEDLLPNPDFWISVLYKRLVGRRVLTLLVKGGRESEILRLFAHCSKSQGGRQGVVVFGFNLASTRQDFSLPDSLTESGEILHYVLSAPGGDLKAREIELNGRDLRLGPGGGLPYLRPERTGPARTLGLGPFQMAFWVFNKIPGGVPACSS